MKDQGCGRGGVPSIFTTGFEPVALASGLRTLTDKNTFSFFFFRGGSVANHPFSVPLSRIVLKRQSEKPATARKKGFTHASGTDPMEKKVVKKSGQKGVKTT